MQLRPDISFMVKMLFSRSLLSSETLVWDVADAVGAVGAAGAVGAVAGVVNSKGFMFASGSRFIWYVNTHQSRRWL